MIFILECLSGFTEQKVRLTTLTDCHSCTEKRLPIFLNSWERHYDNHLKLKEGLARLGLYYFVEDAFGLPQLNAVNIPEGVDDAALRSKLLREHNLEIGGGLGPMAGKIWRIGLMGASSCQKNIDKLLGALKEHL